MQCTTTEEAGQSNHVTGFHFFSTIICTDNIQQTSTQHILYDEEEQSTERDNKEEKEMKEQHKDVREWRRVEEEREQRKTEHRKRSHFGVIFSILFSLWIELCRARY